MLQQWFELHGQWVLPGVFALCFGFLLLRQHLINSAPTYTAAVTVETRTVEPARFHPKWSSGWNYTVTFRLSDGDTLKLFTTSQEYRALCEGRHVTIVWQNENLLRYEE